MDTPLCFHFAVGGCFFSDEASPRPSRVESGDPVVLNQVTQSCWIRCLHDSDEDMSVPLHKPMRDSPLRKISNPTEPLGESVDVWNSFHHSINDNSNRICDCQMRRLPYKKNKSMQLWCSSDGERTPHPLVPTESTPTSRLPNPWMKDGMVLSLCWAWSVVWNRSDVPNARFPWPFMQFAYQDYLSMLLNWYFKRVQAKVPLPMRPKALRSSDGNVCPLISTICTACRRGRTRKSNARLQGLLLGFFLLLFNSRWSGNGETSRSMFFFSKISELDSLRTKNFSMEDG